MPSVTLIRYLYRNTAGWPRSVGSHDVINSTCIFSHIYNNGPQYIGVTTSTCKGDYLIPQVPFPIDALL